MARNRSKTQTARDLSVGTGRLVVLTYEAIQGCCNACGMQDLDYLFLKLRQESLEFVPPK